MNSTETELEELLRKAKDVVMTPEEEEEQRRSWAFGNVALSNPAVTREMVDEVMLIRFTHTTDSIGEQHD